MTTIETNRMNRPWRYPIFIASLAVTMITLTAPAFSIDPKNPDWPCVQRKELTLTAAQMWDGPPITDSMPWRNSKKISELVQILISRRVPIEEAEKAIEEFAASLAKDKKNEQLTLLFAGVLDQTNSRRTRIVKGVEKINIRQKARAKEIEREGVALAKMEESAKAGEKSLTKKIEKAQKAYDWDARVFKERQENIPLACEIPILIEQRAFAIARAIRNRMDD